MAAAAPETPSDLQVAHLMLAMLRTAPEGLSLAQVALTAKDDHPTVPWNFARWMQAVRRGQKARPLWFSAHGDEMLGVGPQPGVEPAEPSAAQRQKDLFEDLFGDS